MASISRLRLILVAVLCAVIAGLLGLAWWVGGPALMRVLQDREHAASAARTYGELSVTYAYSGEEGTVWYETSIGHLFTQAFRNTEAPRVHPLVPGAIRDIAQGKSGTFLLTTTGTRAMIYRYENETYTLRYETEAQKGLLQIAVSDDGDIAFSNAGTLLLLPPVGDPRSLGEGRMPAFAQTSAGEKVLVFATGNHLSVYQLGTEKETVLYTLPSPLSSSLIAAQASVAFTHPTSGAVTVLGLSSIDEVPTESTVSLPPFSLPVAFVGDAVLGIVPADGTDIAIMSSASNIPLVLQFTDSEPAPSFIDFI